MKIFCQSNISKQKMKILINDILVYIASEFLQHKDSFNFCCAFTDIKPYKFYFNDNINSKIKIIDKNCVEEYHFDIYKLCKTNNQLISKKVKINWLITCDRFNKDLNDCFEDIEKTNIKRIQMGRHFNQILPNNLPETLISIELQSLVYNHNIPENLPQNIKNINISANVKLPENLPSSLEFIYLGMKYRKPLPKKLPKSLKIIHIEQFYYRPIVVQFIEINDAKIKFQCTQKELGVITFTYDHENKCPTFSRKIIEIIDQKLIDNLKYFLSIDETKLNMELIK